MEGFIPLMEIITQKSVKFEEVDQNVLSNN